MDEKRIIDLEFKVAHQDYMLEQLSQVLYDQQKKIDQMELLIQQLGKRFKDALGAEGEDIRGHEKPPHY